MLVLNLDFEKTRVVLIGASFFPRDQENLAPIPQIVNNVNALSQIFTDKQIIGIPESNISTILDKSSPSEVLESLAQIAREAKDTLIVYYAGHGLIVAEKLLLAVKDTTYANRAFNSIHFQDFRSAILESEAPKKILIMDCCFSGRAISELQSPLSSRSNTSIGNINLAGTYVITSTPPNKPIEIPLEPGAFQFCTLAFLRGYEDLGLLLCWLMFLQKRDAPLEPKEYTYFSAKLIETLQQGIDNQKSGINLEELYENIRKELASKGMLAPERLNVGDADQITIALNRKFSPSPLPKPLLNGDNSGNLGPPEEAKLPSPKKMLAGFVVIAGLLSALIFAIISISHYRSELRDVQITVHKKYCETILLPNSFLDSTICYVENPQGERFSLLGRDIWKDLEKGKTYCVKLSGKQILKIVNCE